MLKNMNMLNFALVVFSVFVWIVFSRPVIAAPSIDNEQINFVADVVDKSCVLQSSSLQVPVRDVFIGGGHISPPEVYYSSFKFTDCPRSVSRIVMIPNFTERGAWPSHPDDFLPGQLSNEGTGTGLVVRMMSQDPVSMKYSPIRPNKHVPFNVDDSGNVDIHLAITSGVYEPPWALSATAGTFIGNAAFTFDYE